MPDFRLSRHLPAAILILSLSGIYLSTLAPGLTWANDGSDGGDLITAAYTGGIAHPTGYPLYLLLARLFQFIPIGSLAYRTGLLSVTTSALSCMLLYSLVTRTLAARGFNHARLAGLAAGFSFGLAPLVWSQAVIAEVYALQAFLTASVLHLCVFPLRRLGQGHLERIRGLALGLAMGNHVTTILLLPLVLFSRNDDQPDDGASLRTFASSLTRQLVWLSIGLSLYLILPLRALTSPPVNWGNPVTFKRFWWLVSGELYRSYYLQFQFAEIWGRIQSWAFLLLQQFGVPGVILGVAGLIFLFKPTRLYWYTVWMVAACSAVAIVYMADDSYLYLIPACLSFAIWIGLGVGYVMRLSPSHFMRWVLGLLLGGYFIFHAVGNFGQVDASNDLRAERFGRQVMFEVPREALVFVKGDRAVFTVWYFHFALNERPDVIVIAEELLHFDWYQETLGSTYPGLNVPGPLPWAQNLADANPARAVCRIQYTDRAEIRCHPAAEEP